MPLILGTNSIKDTGFDVANSCRFNSGSSDFLGANQFSNTAFDSTKKFTLSVWVKKTSNGVDNSIFGVESDVGSDGKTTQFYFDTSDQLRFYDNFNNVSDVKTNRVFRDNSAFYNIILAVDYTQSTNSNRVKIIVNGEQETSLATSTYANQNDNITALQQNRGIILGVNENTSGTKYGYFNGYMSEFVFLDGIAADQTSFGEVDSDSGIFKPIDVSGLTFGTNGFYLDFEDSSALGNDAAGSNNFTVNNLTATDQSTDTCTNNFAVLNPLNYGANYTFSEGNLQFAQSATNWDTAYSSIAVTKGKWYMEFKGKVGAYYDIGVTDVVDPTNNLTVNSGCVAYKSNGEFARAGAVGDGLPSTVTDPASNTYTADDIMGIAIDVDNEAVYFSKNGTYEVNSDPTSGASKTGAVTLPNSGSTYFFAFAAYKGGAASGTGQVNFGGGSVDAISSGNTDADGFGNFEHAPPSGYFALCTKNLAEYG